MPQCRVMNPAIVVDAGPAGLTAAYHPAKHGARAVVLEADAEYVGGKRASGTPPCRLFAMPQAGTDENKQHNQSKLTKICLLSPLWCIMPHMSFGADRIFVDIRQMDVRGNTIYLVDAIDENGEDCTLGLDDGSVLVPLHKSWEADQFACSAIVVAGLQTAEFIFQGLKQPLKQRDDTEASADKLTYVWRSDVDYHWQGPDDAANFSAGQILYREPIAGDVFSVTVTPNKGKYLDRYPLVHGWIEEWKWLSANKKDAGRPDGWKALFDRQIWSGAGQKTKPARASTRRKR